MRRPAGFSLSAISALHLATLFTLAVAHPVYDALGQEVNSSLFAAHRAGPADIWLLVSLLSVALPLAGFLLLWSIRVLSRTLATGLYVALLLLLSSALLGRRPRSAPARRSHRPDSVGRRRIGVSPLCA